MLDISFMQLVVFDFLVMLARAFLLTATVLKGKHPLHYLQKALSNDMASAGDGGGRDCESSGS